MNRSLIISLLALSLILITKKLVSGAGYPGDCVEVIRMGHTLGDVRPDNQWFKLYTFPTANIAEGTFEPPVLEYVDTYFPPGNETLYSNFWHTSGLAIYYSDKGEWVEHRIVNRGESCCRFLTTKAEYQKWSSYPDSNDLPPPCQCNAAYEDHIASCGGSQYVDQWSWETCTGNCKEPCTENRLNFIVLPLKTKALQKRTALINKETKSL